MCGIAGMVGDPDRETLEAMVSSLRHRGPDGRGVNIGQGWGFGHARLSIIDLEGGHQPMASSVRPLHIVFNGEIYNYRELRRQLEQNGRVFRTKSDTEVILAGYEAWGEGVVDRLNGMFAFAIWDAEEEALFMARDRVGIKPLYYTARGRELAFASEPKALLLLDHVSRELNPVALDAYLDLAYVPPPLSMFRDLRQLPPGHVATWRAGELSLRRYWDARPQGEDPRSVDEWAETVEPILVDAVRRRMIADVPVGAFLSGGLDSSMIVAIASGTRSEPLDTFSVGYGSEGASYDERAGAREVARAFGTRHHELVLGNDTLGGLGAVVAGFDEPFGSPTALLTHALSRFARTQVKVALAGDGGDEVFGGYPRYRGMQLSELASGVPSGLLDPLRRLLRGPEVATARNYRRWARQFLDGLRRPAAARYASWVGYATEAERDSLLAPRLQSELRAAGRLTSVQSAYARPASGSAIQRAGYADLHGFLPENVLRCTDRMSMAAGLEVRVPLCDHRLVELGAAVPGWKRINAMATKRVLRKIARTRLPPSVLRRRKLGFNGPMGTWMREQLPRVRRDWLSSERVRARGLLQPGTVERFLSEHEAGHRDHSLRLWSLMVLEQWHRTYLDASDGTIP